MRIFRAVVGAGWLLALACSSPERSSRTPIAASVQESAADSLHLASKDASTERGARELNSFDPSIGLDQVWYGDLNAVVERGYLRALVVYSKTHYFLDGATQRGLSYEALREFERFMNRRLGRKTLRVDVVILPVERDEIFPALERGLADLAAANLTVTAQRLRVADFARPFGQNVRELVITGPSGPTLAGLEDLSGLQIHVRRSSSYWNSLETLNSDFLARGFEPVRLVAVEEHLQDEDLLEMVHAGLLPTIVTDSHIVNFWRDIFDGLVVHEDLAVREGGEIAWALRKNCPELKKMVDDFVREYPVGSLTTNVLLKRYLKDNRWVRDPSAQSHRRRFEATVGLFRRYGQRYDFDYLILAALGYQESQLDQSKRSPAGALGIMQLLPSTAADPNVGIPDIAEAENNVHAGAKYLHFLRNRYFSVPEIDPINAVLFSFAAYNAGPARIARLRDEAEQAGLNPNVWFANVERIAARRIGRETVQYVSNISKYYIAYRLAAEQGWAANLHDGNDQSN